MIVLVYKIYNITLCYFRKQALVNTLQKRSKTWATCKMEFFFQRHLQQKASEKLKSVLLQTSFGYKQQISNNKWSNIINSKTEMLLLQQEGEVSNILLNDTIKAQNK